MIERAFERRTAWLIVLAGFAVRMLACALAPIPAEDAANYLWMAERFAAGDAGAALSEVFPPMLSLLTAPWVAIGLDPFRAGQLAAAICGALALYPAMRATEIVTPRYGVAAGILMVFSPLAVRFCGQVYSEPVFLLFGALALWAALRGRFVVAGCAAGAAFWARPEALALAVGFVVLARWRGPRGGRGLPVGAAAPTLQPGRVVASAATGPETGESSGDATIRRVEDPSQQSGRGLPVGAAAPTLQPGRVVASAAMAIVPLAAAVVGLAAWRDRAGYGFDLLPKLWFNAARGDAALAPDGLHLDRVLDNLLLLPSAWFEAFQLLGLLVLWGIWTGRRRRDLRPHLATLAVALVAIVLFLTRRRFLVGWLFVLAPFATVALAAMPERGRWPTVWVIALTSLLSSLKIEPADRIGEKEVGVYLRQQIRPGERVEGDMTRVIWFAGSRPLPPKPFTVDELVERARQPGVRFVVLGARRATAAPVRERLGAGFASYPLPERERRAAELRGILVLERR